MNIGQMFLVGFRGSELKPTDWIVKSIQDRDLGGVILFDRNISGAIQNFDSPSGLTRLVDSLHSLAATPLFIAVDQEGGKVCRLKENNNFPPICSAACMAKEGLDATRQQADLLAQTLHAHGINLNFAPVVDLNLNPNNPIIGKFERSFGTNVSEVVAHARLFIEQHHKYGIGCCIKHFPGHGSSKNDSHLGFVDITEDWQEIELEPYRELISNGYSDGVMTGHLVHRGLDRQGKPATLSPLMINNLLREKLRFSGVVFSDDLQMTAISKRWSYRQAVQEAVMAGVDMLVIGNNLCNQENAVEQGIDAVTELLKQGRVSKERIEQSIQNIWYLKQKIGGKRPWKNNNRPTV